MLLATVPPAFILPAIDPTVYAISLLLIFIELALIAISVVIILDTISMAVAVFPFTIISFSVFPVIVAPAVHSTILPFSFKI